MRLHALHTSKKVGRRSNFPRLLYIPMVPSAERRAPVPPVETLLPASVDRFPCFHTCRAYEQKKRAIPGRFSNLLYITYDPSAGEHTRLTRCRRRLPPCYRVSGYMQPCLRLPERRKPIIHARIRAKKWARAGAMVLVLAVVAARSLTARC